MCRRLFECYKHNKVFNADLVGAYNILLKAKTIPPSPAMCGVGVTRLRPGAELNPETGDVAPNLPELSHFRVGRRPVPNLSPAFESGLVQKRT
ncbi:MAG: hypothetical protein QW543_06240 [Sulfolobales archaeon]